MRIFKPDKHVLGSVAILAAFLGLIVLTWAGTLRAIQKERVEDAARVTATVVNQAVTFSEQVNRQILGLDQTLRILVHAWEADPRQFDLETWRHQSVVLSGISRDMLLIDENGIIRQSSVPEAVGRNVRERGYFRDAAGRPLNMDRLYIGPASIDPTMRQWHLDVARTLHHPDGSFAGLIDADYRISAITNVFNQADLGIGTFAAVVGLTDGNLRAAIGPAAISPDTSIAETRMFAAIKNGNSGTWIGPSATDSVVRVHAYRALPDRDLVLVVGVDEQEAMESAKAWRRQAGGFAVCITLLLLAMAAILIRGLRLARQRELRLAEDRAILAAANAQLEVARARADAKTEQLEATLAGMTDGVAMVDAQMCLLEWNARFPEVAGVPAEILRVGQPMEELLRAQALTGQFGAVDVDAEVARRMAALRAGRYGTTRRVRPDGRSLELRRNRLPDGGFVTLYSDVTDRQRAEDALREARGIAEAANAAKSRFVAVVSHEIRTPLNALLNTLRLLADSAMAPAQQSLVDMARRSGDALFGLINDVLEMSRMEAGQLTLRQSRFALRPLLESSLELFQVPAVERGIAFELAIADSVPAEMVTDPGRLRQVLLNLLSNAVKFASPGPVRLTALTENGRLRLALQDCSPVIPAEDRARLFRPFTQLERPGGDTAVGTGLGLAICHHLVSLMGGEIGCDAAVCPTGQPGNAFWLTLPLPDLPDAAEASPSSRPEPAERRQFGRRLPRTRILLVDDVLANQVVTATLLRREGHMVDVVSTGTAAVRAVSRTPYDLIFMDIFMPGMSGQEAVQRIRALPGPARTVPIIALTANVSEHDETTFRATGMDGLLHKPVSLSGLLDALGRYVWHKGMPAMPPATPALTMGANDQRPVLSVQRIKELRDNLTPETFAGLIEECLTDLDHRFPALRRALTAGTLAAIGAQAHAMVGMAAGYGMAALEGKLRAVMDAARDGTVDPNATAEVEAELTRTAATLRDMTQKELA
jgi:signal transduction histidine kinase/CheY-like chemotaxis protein